MISALQKLLEPYPKEEVYLVGVSGGCDSVVLLHLLRSGLGFRRLVLAHLDHQLRGEESDADAAFVKALAEQHDLVSEIGVVDVAALSKRERLSTETAARQARQRFFHQTAVRYQATKLFLGHHADDQVETVLMNLFRGSGIQGLQGMRSVGNLPHPDGGQASLEVIRPLLSFIRADLTAYALEHELVFREDSSNADPQHLRNRVRHELIPQIHHLFQRDTAPAILRLTRQSAAENAYFDELIAETALAERLPVSLLRRKHEALQRRLLHRWLTLHGASNLSFDLVEKARTLLPEGTRVAKINLPGNLHLRRRKGEIFIETSSVDSGNLMKERR